MIEIRYYVDDGGKAPFADWVEELETFAAAKVSTVLRRIAAGNHSNLKGVGEGGLEFRIDFGPGYLVYFGRDGDTLVILLTGGTKKRQQRDILDARGFWQDYKRTKRTMKGDI
jgi:putative addiction module killer protein